MPATRGGSAARTRTRTGGPGRAVAGGRGGAHVGGKRAGGVASRRGDGKPRCAARESLTLIPPPIGHAGSPRALWGDDGPTARCTILSGVSEPAECCASHVFACGGGLHRREAAAMMHFLSFNRSNNDDRHSDAPPRSAFPVRETRWPPSCAAAPCGSSAPRTKPEIPVTPRPSRSDAEPRGGRLATRAGGPRSRRWAAPPHRATTTRAPRAQVCHC
eukprot:1194575-Prorocentrum_minimum.AAC.3